MEGIGYFDIRHVQGRTTSIDIDNGSIETATESFFDHAVIRALGHTGCGIILVDNFQDMGDAAIEGDGKKNDRATAPANKRHSKKAGLDKIL